MCYYLTRLQCSSLILLGGGVELADKKSVKICKLPDVAAGEGSRPKQAAAAAPGVPAHSKSNNRGSCCHQRLLFLLFMSAMNLPSSTAECLQKPIERACYVASASSSTCCSTASNSLLLLLLQTLLQHWRACLAHGPVHSSSSSSSSSSHRVSSSSLHHQQSGLQPGPQQPQLQQQLVKHLEGVAAVHALCLLHREQLQLLRHAWQSSGSSSSRNGSNRSLLQLSMLRRSACWMPHCLMMLMQTLTNCCSSSKSSSSSSSSSSNVSGQLTGVLYQTVRTRKHMILAKVLQQQQQRQVLKEVHPQQLGLHL
jgi:hypothetical protein